MHSGTGVFFFLRGTGVSIKPNPGLKTGTGSNNHKGGSSSLGIKKAKTKKVEDPPRYTLRTFCETLNLHFYHQRIKVISISNLTSVNLTKLFIFYPWAPSLIFHKQSQENLAKLYFDETQRNCIRVDNIIYQCICKKLYCTSISKIVCYQSLHIILCLISGCRFEWM